MNRYDLGDGSFLRSFKDGDQLVRALRLVSQETVSLRNIAKIQELVQKQCGLEDMSVVVEVPLNNFFPITCSRILYVSLCKCVQQYLRFDIILKTKIISNN